MAEGKAHTSGPLIREHGAARIDIVHRHDIPRFERVSWKFVDPHVEQTIAVRGYWRLPKSEQEKIATRFWEVGRLTLEHWLTPRLNWEGVTQWPGTEVVDAAPVGDDGELRVRLSNGTQLAVDRVVFASGYRADLTKIPYLAVMLKEVKLSNGFPLLEEAFQTSFDRLYVTGFPATQDLGPFFGFVKGSPASATLIVRDLLSRN